jgi:hypothetical protein
MNESKILYTLLEEMRTILKNAAGLSTGMKAVQNEPQRSVRLTLKDYRIIKSTNNVQANSQNSQLLWTELLC